MKRASAPVTFELMYQRRNRLGLALMTHTHMQEVVKDLKRILESGNASKGFFSHSAEEKAAPRMESRFVRAFPDA